MKLLERNRTEWFFITLGYRELFNIRYNSNYISGSSDGFDNGQLYLFFSTMPVVDPSKPHAGRQYWGKLRNNKES